MAGRSPRILKWLLFLAALLLLFYLARPLWLKALGQALVHDDGPAKADIAVVLAGDFYGHRIEEAAELVREGYVPAALVDGPAGVYGIHESTLAIQFIVAKGSPSGWFVDFPIQANSTQEEAALVLPELRRRNVHSYLLVTSDYHSARAARVFRAMQRASGYAASMRVVIARDEHFAPDTWWHTREGRKTAFMEWMKTAAEALGQ